MTTVDAAHGSRFAVWRKLPGERWKRVAAVVTWAEAFRLTDGRGDWRICSEPRSVSDTSSNLFSETDGEGS